MLRLPAGTSPICTPSASVNTKLASPDSSAARTSTSLLWSRVTLPADLMPSLAARMVAPALCVITPEDWIVRLPRASWAPTACWKLMPAALPNTKCRLLATVTMLSMVPVTLRASPVRVTSVAATTTLPVYVWSSTVVTLAPRLMVGAVMDRLPMALAPPTSPPRVTLCCAANVRSWASVARLPSAAESIAPLNWMLPAWLFSEVSAPSTTLPVYDWSSAVLTRLPLRSMLPAVRLRLPSAAKLPISPLSVTLPAPAATVRSLASTPTESTVAPKTTLLSVVVSVVSLPTVTAPV